MSDPDPQLASGGSLFPPRDRRRGKRIFTLRNSAFAAAVLLGLFLIVSIVAEFRRPASGSHGRLYNARVSATDVQVKRAPITVVKEESVTSSESADPLLLQGAAREQYLGMQGQSQVRASDQTVPYGQTVTSGTTPLSGGQGTGTISIQRSSSSKKRDAKIKITGGPEGVKVEGQ